MLTKTEYYKKIQKQKKKKKIEIGLLFLIKSLIS